VANAGRLARAAAKFQGAQTRVTREGMAQPARARCLGVFVERDDGEAPADVLEREVADGDF
jgi:hypothetical protein